MVVIRVICKCNVYATLPTWIHSNIRKPQRTRSLGWELSFKSICLKVMLTHLLRLFGPKWVDELWNSRRKMRKTRIQMPVTHLRALFPSTSSAGVIKLSISEARTGFASFQLEPAPTPWNAFWYRRVPKNGKRPMQSASGEPSLFVKNSWLSNYSTIAWKLYRPWRRAFY